MEFAEFKEQIQAAPPSKKTQLKRLFLYTTSGNGILPEFAGHLKDARSYRDFFDAIYADDERRFTTVWAEWAILSNKKWLDRFLPKIAISNIRLKGDGLPVEFGTGIVLAPTGSRDNIAEFRLYPSGGFNTQAARFVTSIGGSFTCSGYDFCGIYGLYCHRGTVIFEEWQAERDPVPTKSSEKRLG